MFDQSLRILSFNPKEYLGDFCRAVISFFISSFIFYFLKDFSYIPIFLHNEYMPISKGIIKIVVWILSFFFLKAISNFLKRGVKYSFNPSDWPKKWIFHGLNNIQTNSNTLVIKHSGSGCLLKDYLWKNFEMTFEMKFFSQEDIQPPDNIHDESMGIIFRANNLDTYFMLEIYIKDNDFYIKPHVRTDGIWEIVDIKNIGAISVNDYLNVKLNVQDRTVTLFINDRKIYEWFLPTHTEKNAPDPSAIKTQSEAKTVPAIPFITSYGMVGFRANWFQGVIIKNLYIKTLSKLDSILLINHRIKV